MRERGVGGVVIQQFLGAKATVVKRSIEPIVGIQMLSKSLAEKSHPPRDIAELQADFTNAGFAASDIEDFSLGGWVRSDAGDAK